jgi:hypothetical protein
MSNLPEEIEAMAYLIGQSNQIDSMMVDKPSTLITSTQTLKKGLGEYVQQQRQQAPQVAPPTYPVQYPQVPQPEILPIPNYTPPAPQKVDNGQLELNLEPTKIEEIIFLLKEISIKLTKQNNLLEKMYGNQSKKEGIFTSTSKSSTN